MSRAKDWWWKDVGLPLVFVALLVGGLLALVFWAVGKPQELKEIRLDAVEEVLECRLDAECWSKKYADEGALACSWAVEELANRSGRVYEWDGYVPWQERFPDREWLDVEKGKLVLSGSAIEIENDRGDLVQNSYGCAFSPLSDPRTARAWSRPEA